MFASGVARQVRRRTRGELAQCRSAAFCSRKPTVPASRLLTIRAILSTDRGFGEPHKLGPVAASRVQEMGRTAFVGDQMMHGGQKGFGMTKHGRSGHATRSPRFRFLQKLEAQKNDRKDRSRINDPKQSVEELFHPGSQHEPDELSLDGLRG